MKRDVSVAASCGLVAVSVAGEFFASSGQLRPSSGGNKPHSFKRARVERALYVRARPRPPLEGEGVLPATGVGSGLGSGCGVAARQPLDAVAARNTRLESQCSTEDLMDYDAYRQSPEWAVMRRWKIDEADHRCQLCDATGPVLDVHHRTYERIGRELQADLVVLCRACHAAVHGRESAPTMREAYAAQSTRPVSEVIAKIKAAESRGDNVEAERLAQETLIAKRREAERELEAKQGGAEVVP